MVKHKTLWITIFVLPCMFLFAIIYAMPIMTLIYTSFTKYTAFSPPVWCGLSNYKALLFHDSNFWKSIGNTLIWVLLQTTFHVCLGLFVALLLYRKPFGWKFIRTTYLIPNIIPTSATGVMFLLLLNPDIGILKTIFVKMGWNATQVPNLFGNSKYAFITVTITWIFYSAFNTIIFISEIGAIPKDIYESAYVDGATGWQTDWYITLPLLKNSIRTCVVLASTAMVSQFDILYMTTRGGPGTSTLNLPMYLYKTSSLQMDYGTANTIGVFQIVLGISLVLLINTIFRSPKEKWGD